MDASPKNKVHGGAGMSCVLFARIPHRSTEFACSESSHACEEQVLSQDVTFTGVTLDSRLKFKPDLENQHQGSGRDNVSQVGFAWASFSVCPVGTSGPVELPPVSASGPDTDASSSRLVRQTNPRPRAQPRSVSRGGFVSY